MTNIMDQNQRGHSFKWLWVAMCHIQYVLNGDKERISESGSTCLFSYSLLLPSVTLEPIFLSNKLTFLTIWSYAMMVHCVNVPI